MGPDLVDGSGLEQGAACKLVEIPDEITLLGEPGLLLEVNECVRLFKSHQVDVDIYDGIHSGPENSGSELYPSCIPLYSGLQCNDHPPPLSIQRGV